MTLYDTRTEVGKARSKLNVLSKKCALPEGAAAKVYPKAHHNILPYPKARLPKSTRTRTQDH